MKSSEPQFRKTFAVSVALHVAVIVAFIFGEGFIAHISPKPPQVVEVITPADIIGDLPPGHGRPGRGQYTPPPPAAPPSTGGESPGPSTERFTPVEKPVPVPPPRVVRQTVPDPNEIQISKKPTPVVTKPVAPPPVKPPQPTPPTTTARKTGANGKSDTKVASVSHNPSAADFRHKFDQALRVGGGNSGTVGGDNQPAGGGDGIVRHGRIGNPEGAADGVPGGIGKGSPFWSYYLHIRDRMYEAWDRPGQANWDKHLLTTVKIRVAPDGRIIDVRLQDSSGNKLMDDTAVSAARKVEKLNPPPEGLAHGSSAEIAVLFQLEG